MKIDPTTFLLDDATYIASPNCDHFADNADVNLLVIHSISLPPAEYGGDSIIKFFTNQLDCTRHPFFTTLIDLKVSAHLLIRRDGELIQFVPFNQRAWHAGQSEFAGRCNCNDFSIGIELEGTDQSEFTEAQYVQLTAVTCCLRKIYPNITQERIVGHSDIAPQRKTDPGVGFDWKKYFSMLAPRSRLRL